MPLEKETPAEPQIDMERPFTGAAAAQPASPAPVPDATAGAGATPASPAPAQPDFTQSEYYTTAKSLGLPLDGISDEKALLKAALAAYQVERPYAQHARASLATPASPPVQAGQPHKQDKGRPEQTAEDQFDSDKHFKALWNAPQMDEHAKFAIEKGLVQLDDNGLYVPTPGPFEAQVLPIINGLNQAHHAQRQQLAKFFEGNPYQHIAEALEPYFRHKFSRDFQDLSAQSLETYEQQAFIEKWEADNSAWLFGKDAAGNKILTADGQKFHDTVQELREQGINDPQKLAAWALKLTGVNPHAGTQAVALAAPAAPAPSTPAADAGRARGPDGKFLPAEKTKQESFIDKARERASASPSAGGGYSPQHAVVANQGDLDSMFTTAWRQAAAV